MRQEFLDFGRDLPSLGSEMTKNRGCYDYARIANIATLFLSPVGTANPECVKQSILLADARFLLLGEKNIDIPSPTPPFEKGRGLVADIACSGVVLIERSGIRILHSSTYGG